MQDEDLLVQHYPYLRGGRDIYSCADEHRVGGSSVRGACCLVLLAASCQRLEQESASSTLALPERPHMAAKVGSIRGNCVQAIACSQVTLM